MSDSIDHFVETLMKHHDIPGMSLAVVYKNTVICTKGYGIKNRTHGNETKNLVGEHTKFCIGSLTKAFTSAVWASILQHMKGVGWDTPLRELVDKGSPVFNDDFRTSRTCLRDVLSHKLGIELGESDFGWVCDAFPSTYHLIKNAKHLPFSADFRTKMMYNNYMYAIAGYLSDLIKGESWESMVGDLFSMLGMNDSGFIHQPTPGSTSSSVKDLAHPHMAIKGKSTLIDLAIHRSIGKLAAAGSIYSSAADMAQWMLFHLNHGSIAGTQLIDKRWLDECYKPHFALPDGKPEWNGYIKKPDFSATETRDAYGFGWWTGTYRELRTVAHAGELFGYDSLLTLYPDVELGIYTCFNGPGGEPAHVGNQLIHYYIADQILDLPQWLTAEHALMFPLPWKDNVHTYFPPKVHTEIERGICSQRPMLCYNGIYSHPLLGDIDISIPKSNTCLSMKYGKHGKFVLHPNGVENEFRMEAVGHLQFIYQVDLYSPSDWMTVHFNFDRETDEKASHLYCSWFESSPAFERID